MYQAVLGTGLLWCGGQFRKWTMSLSDWIDQMSANGAAGQVRKLRKVPVKWDCDVSRGANEGWVSERWIGEAGFSDFDERGW